jgi:hypothetical protein
MATSLDRSAHEDIVYSFASQQIVPGMDCRCTNYRATSLFVNKFLLKVRFSPIHLSVSACYDARKRCDRVLLSSEEYKYEKKLSRERKYCVEML